YDLQWRGVRLLAVDADPEPAAIGDPRHAQDRTPAGRRWRQDRDPADDVCRADLRSPHHRRPRSSDVSGADQGVRRRPLAPPVRYLSRRGNMAERYDVVIIGAGPGGYVAAFRPAQLGMKPACIDSRATPGGTCLNIGCIPSKALLQSSEKYAETRNGLAEHGIKISKADLDLAAMMARKDKVVTTLTRGVEFLFRKNKVEWIKGTARIAMPGRIAVTANDGGSREIEAGAIVVATGSESIPLPGLAIDEERIVSSTGALALDRVPERLAVIGGGYIGLELGSVWSRLGSQVTVIEFLDRILSNMDRELGPALQRLLTRSGVVFRLATKVVSGELRNEGVTLGLEAAKGGARETLAADAVLVAIGRR